MNCGIILPLLFLLIIVVFFGGIAAGLLFYLSRLNKRMKAIGDTPLSKAGELRDGLSKVHGQVVGQGEPLVSPLSKTPCVYYRFKVEEQRTRTVSGGPRSGAHTHTYWHPVIDDKKAIRCSLEDQTGRADVQLLEAEMVLDTRAHERSGMLRDASPKLKDMLWEEYGYSTKGILFTKSVRYSEQVIQEGDVLFVLGDVQTRKGRPPLFAKGEHPFIIADRNEAGVLTHYKRKITWCYVGLVATAVLSILFSAVPLFFLLLVLFASSKMPAPSTPNVPVAAPPVQAPPPPEEIQRRPPPPDRPAVGGLPAPDRPAVGAVPVERPRGDQAIKPERADEKKPEPGRAAVNWAVEPDAVGPPPGPLNLKGSLPAPFMGLVVLSTSAHSSMLAMAPPGIKDKSQVQVYDLRQMKPVGKLIRGSFGAFNQKFALSPDGAYFATLAPTAARSTVEVWSAATGESVRKIEVDPDPQMKVSMFDFVWDNHLITLKHKGEFVDFEVECAYQVWDLKTGAEVTHFSYDLRFIPRWGTFTPGRHYMVMEHTRGKGEFHIVFWDLRTGQQAGDLRFQGKDDPWGQASGIAFTPDGEKMALLWRLANGQDRWLRLYCFDVKSGKKLRDVPRIDSKALRGEHPWIKGGTFSIQWLPDGSGLLLFGYLLVDYESGAVVWKIGPEPMSDNAIANRRFLDPDHVTTQEGKSFSQKLTILTLPRAEIDAAVKKARQAARDAAK
jgi:hypothetical protein